ncbi:hypothetical protein D1007_20859 [Hordeum vulgare]|nr:hypothetical protein D1007_20859 [Hordeum vulgare]
MSRKTVATPQMKATAKASRVVTPTSKAVDPSNRGRQSPPRRAKLRIWLQVCPLGWVTWFSWTRRQRGWYSWCWNLEARRKELGDFIRWLGLDLGRNVFEVHFGSEGDWRHVLHNGPWQFDFSVLIVKEYDGGTRPSEMVFDKVEMWVQVHDLPPDKRMEEFGNALGSWLGKVVRVDVDEEGKAKGQHLRVRAQISVFEPLVRGFFLRSSREEKSKLWFDFHYEKVPHFCFECDRLVHVDGVSDPPVDSSSQWGGWLRALSDKHGVSKGGSQGGGGGSNNSLGSGRQGDSEQYAHRMTRVRDLPTKRNLHSEFSCTGDSRTGEENRPGGKDVRSPINSRGIAKEQHERDLRYDLEQKREEVLRGKLVEQ